MTIAEYAIMRFPFSMNKENEIKECIDMGLWGDGVKLVTWGKMGHPFYSFQSGFNFKVFAKFLFSSKTRHTKLFLIIMIAKF